MLTQYGLYFVLDTASVQPHKHLELARAAAQGGVHIVQLRDKKSAPADLVELIRALRNIFKPLGIPLIINDYVDLAKEADGVHLGQSDGDAVSARAQLGPHAIIGLSVETLDQAIAARELPIDYLGVSPIFLTSTKPELTHAWGLDGLTQLSQLTRQPLVAIGGISATNAAQVIAAGADGVAVISALCSASDPEHAAQELRRIIDDAREKRSHEQ